MSVSKTLESSVTSISPPPFRSNFLKLSFASVFVKDSSMIFLSKGVMVRVILRGHMLEVVKSRLKGFPIWLKENIING